MPEAKVWLLRGSRVNTGFVGRNICGYLRRQGKVVLDVGSLFDYWSGFRKEIILPSIKKMIFYNRKTKFFQKLPQYKDVIL